MQILASILHSTVNYVHSFSEWETQLVKVTDRKRVSVRQGKRRRLWHEENLLPMCKILHFHSCLCLCYLKHIWLAAHLAHIVLLWPIPAQRQSQPKPVAELKKIEHKHQVALARLGVRLTLANDYFQTGCLKQQYWCCVNKVLSRNHSS